MGAGMVVVSGGAKSEGKIDPMASVDSSKCKLTGVELTKKNAVPGKSQVFLNCPRPPWGVEGAALRTKGIFQSAKKCAPDELVMV